MQLDQTHVVIRLRTLAEIGDLALVMLRRYPAAIFTGFVVGAIPFVICNALLLSWIPWRESSYGLQDEEATNQVMRYLYWMAVLVVLQTPVAGIFTTFYLGQAVFEHRPTWSTVFRVVLGQAPRWLYKLGVKRLAFPVMLLLVFRYGTQPDVFYDLLLPTGVVLTAMLIRGMRPFLPEILVLENCPLRTTSPSVIAAGPRSKSLHSVMSSDLLGRFIAVAFVLFFLFLSVMYSIMFVRGITLGTWEWDLFHLLVFYPLALWIVASLSVFVRLLGYLDTRIRLEGWEVDLAVRAERLRQFGEEEPKKVAKTGTVAVLAMAMTGGMMVSGILSGSVAFAQSNDPAADALSESIWYDADLRQTVPVEVKDETKDSDNRDSRWLPKAERLSKQQTSTTTGGMGTTSAGLFGTGITFGTLLGWALVFLIVAIAIGAFIYAVMTSSLDINGSANGRNRSGTRLVDEQTLERVRHLPKELRRTDVNMRDEAERLMNAGQFEQAIILLFGHQLLLLDRVGMLRLNRAKTNRKYIRETNVANVHASERLGQTVECFERSYFGKHEIDGDEFRQLWVSNERLEAEVADRVGIAV